jgi:dTDP-4-amino-4,6-dideoxygalactose transaminase
MTLREAAGMILASAGLAAELAPGEASSLFVPDPGTPVRILDLAEAMIRGAGLVPGQDIEIRIVGLRPGEKVVEELVLESEILAGTRAGWLRRASSPPVPSARLETFVANLERALEHPDPEGILRCLGDLPSGPRWPGATPTPQGSGERAFIPFSRPAIGPEEIGEVVDTLESGWITTGPKTARFEELFGEYIGVPAAVAVSSGTAGLHLALTALGLGPGDEVITSPLTFCATVNTILETGATPVLADVGEDFNLDPEAVCRQVTERTRAIVPVHYGGLPCRMHQIWALARERGLRVVEDAAHAVGSHYGGFPVGAGNPSRGFRSDATCFSFYATKNLTTGEGGMVVTHDPELAARMRVLSLHGISRDAWRRRSLARDWHYEVVARGFKYNLGDIQSAIGIHQLAKQEQFVRIRTRWAGLYNDAFRGIPGIETPPDSEDARHSWHLYALRLDPDRLDIGRDEFIEALGGKGVGASVHFIPIPMHPAYADLGREMRNHCPRALDLYPRLVSLPLYPTLGASGVAAVIGAVLETVAAHRKN